MSLSVFLNNFGSPVFVELFCIYPLDSMLKYFLSLACLSALCFNGIGGTEEHSNIIGAKGEQEFLDNAIHLPKARLYTKENLTGEFEDPKSFGTNALRCANLDKGNGTRYFFPEVKSVDTFGTCVRIYEGLWCEGLSLAIYPGSPFTHNISLSNLQTIKSISPCLQNEFENAQIESNSLGYRIFKDPKRTQSLDIVPDEIPFFSPINTTTIYPQCGIIQQERGFQNRVEYVKIEIERDTLRSDEVVKKIQIPPKVEEFYGKLQKEEGDVLGWAVPLELGGPVEEMNAFPLNRNVREEFQRVVSKVNGIFGSNESIQRVHFSVNFVYFDENSTRPDAFSYWIIQDYGEGANYYDLLRNSVSMNLTNLTTDADQKLIETALNHPKGRIEFSREGSITDVLEFDTSNSSDFPRCQNFIRFQDSNETFTVKSFGTCIRLFQYSNCRGKSVAIYPGSSVMATDVRTKDHDDYRTVVLSIGPCLLQEFKHSKVIELNGTTVVVKDTSLFKDLTSIPDVLFDISGDDRVATFVRCPIRQVSLKYDQIIEFMMTAVIKKYIMSNETIPQAISSKVEKYYEVMDKNEGDVLGFALPLEFGGPMKPYNVFPMTSKCMQNLKKVYSETAMLLDEESDHNSWVGLTFLYGNSTTRPNGILYKIFNEHESPVSSGFIKN